MEQEHEVNLLANIEPHTKWSTKQFSSFIGRLADFWGCNPEVKKDKQRLKVKAYEKIAYQGKGKLVHKYDCTLHVNLTRVHLSDQYWRKWSILSIKFAWLLREPFLKEKQH